MKNSLTLEEMVNGQHPTQSRVEGSYIIYHCDLCGCDVRVIDLTIGAKKITTNLVHDNPYNHTGSTGSKTNVAFPISNDN